MARSNRQLTQFAVNKLRQYIALGPDRFEDEQAGNTAVRFFACDKCHRRSVQVWLYEEKVLEMVVNPFNSHNIVGMLIFSGNFYDSKGRPSRTTRERLNGLLDFLGTQEIIPSGIRVFLREDGTCCVGKGNACKQFNIENPSVGLLAHPNDLVFA